MGFIDDACIYVHCMYTGSLDIYVSLRNFDVSLYSGDFVSYIIQCGHLKKLTVQTLNRAKCQHDIDFTCMDIFTVFGMSTLFNPKVVE